MTGATMTQCSAVKPDGGRCGVRANLRATPDGPRCLWHDEARRKEATEARRKGQRAATEKRKGDRVRTVEAKEAPPMPKTLDEVADWLAWLAVAVVTGQVDARTAKEATTAVDKLRLALKDRDKLDERLKDAHEKLTKALAQKERRR